MNIKKMDGNKWYKILVLIVICLHVSSCYSTKEMTNADYFAHSSFCKTMLSIYPNYKVERCFPFDKNIFKPKFLNFSIYVYAYDCFSFPLRYVFDDRDLNEKDKGIKNYIVFSRDSSFSAPLLKYLFDSINDKSKIDEDLIYSLLELHFYLIDPVSKSYQLLRQKNDYDGLNISEKESFEYKPYIFNKQNDGINVELSIYDKWRNLFYVFNINFNNENVIIEFKIDRRFERKVIFL